MSRNAATRDNFFVKAKDAKDKVKLRFNNRDRRAIVADINECSSATYFVRIQLPVSDYDDILMQITTVCKLTLVITKNN